MTLRALLALSYFSDVMIYRREGSGHCCDTCLMRWKWKMSAESSRTQNLPVIQLVLPQAGHLTMQQNANSFEQSGWLIRRVGLWNCCVCWLFVSELSSCSCRFALRRHLWWWVLILMHRNKTCTDERHRSLKTCNRKEDGPSSERGPSVTDTSES